MKLSLRKRQRQYDQRTKKKKKNVMISLYPRSFNEKFSFIFAAQCNYTRSIKLFRKASSRMFLFT